MEPERSRRALLVGCGVLAGGLSLAGCAALMPPKETKLVVKISTDATINPSPAGTPSPLLIRVYTLKSDTKFLQSDAQSLYGNDTAVLGTDLVGKREFILAPDGKDGYSATVPAEATAVGVVAGFRELDIAQWRVSGPIKPDELNTATIVVNDVSVAMMVRAEAKALPF